MLTVSPDANAEVFFNREILTVSFLSKVPIPPGASFFDKYELRQDEDGYWYAVDKGTSRISEDCFILRVYRGNDEVFHYYRFIEAQIRRMKKELNNLMQEIEKVMSG